MSERIQLDYRGAADADRPRSYHESRDAARQAASSALGGIQLVEVECGRLLDNDGAVRAKLTRRTSGKSGKTLLLRRPVYGTADDFERWDAAAGGLPFAEFARQKLNSG